MQLSINRGGIPTFGSSMSHVFALCPTLYFLACDFPLKTGL